MIHLDHRDSRPIYLQIADAFRRQIEAGVLSPGDKLPSVRELSASLTINPNTIQRAYRELENGQGQLCQAGIPFRGQTAVAGVGQRGARAPEPGRCPGGHCCTHHRR